MYNAQDLPSQLLGEMVYLLFKSVNNWIYKKSLFGRKGVTEIIEEYI